MQMRAAVGALVLAFVTVPCAIAQSSGFSDKDKTFLKDSAEDNLGEIKMAQLVLKTSKNADIRAFASEMVKDHTSLLNGSKPVAMKAGVKPPTSTSAAAEANYLKLKVLTGETFDKSYVKTMVSDHHEDLNKAKTENATTTNADMKKLSGHAADVIGEHSHKVDALAAKMGVQ